MKLHRFVLNFNIKTGEIKFDDRELFNQIGNVLKLKIGEKVILCDGNMNEGTAEIKEYGKDFIKVEVGEIKVNQNEPLRHIILYCAILKKENFGLVVQKATEVGVKEIVPLITSRTIKLDVRKDRLDKIIKEAAEQSGRGIVPILRNPINFDEAIKAGKDNSVNLFFDCSGESFNKSDRLDHKGLIGIWIGPEGGWTDAELQLAKKSDFQIINLGKLTLRAETAAIIASYEIINKQ